MGIIDVILLVIIGITAFRGFLKGLVMEIFSFIAIFMAFFAAYEFCGFFSKGVSIFGFADKTNNAIGYVLAFVMAYILVIFLGIIVSKVFKEVKLGWLNQGGGAVFGGFKAAALSGVFLSLLLTILPGDSTLAKSIATGQVSGKVADLAPVVFDVMNKIPKVKKDNPFIKHTGLDTDAVDEAVENAADAVDTVKETADAVEKAKDVTEPPLKDLQDEFQKN